MAEQKKEEQLEIFKQQLWDAIINADVVKIFDNLLTIWVEMDASDIHIEAFESYCRMRLRVDGELTELVQYPKSLHDSIISKFKIESWQMRPDERRIPQDARVSSITLTNKEIDLRASTLPTVWWEKLVMRIVDKSKKTPDIGQLGIQWTNNQLVRKHINSPNGIILNTWPTWSGKTATLYAALDDINRINVNITTFEDPVENKMDGLNQSQVRDDIGFTFESWLRAALRQDPDIIMVWEIRDHETLSMAMEAAMTWHLVFSTIHTNSAAETITRVFNLWAESYMVAGTFNLVIAQRLVRRICSSCQEEKSVKGTQEWKDSIEAFYDLDKAALQKEVQLREIDSSVWDKYTKEWIVTYWTGKLDGETCPTCGGSWYKGRTGIFEMMEYNNDIKNFLLRGKTAYEIEHFALARGMINLERDGVLKVIQWITTLDEVYKITIHREVSSSSQSQEDPSDE